MPSALWKPEKDGSLTFEVKIVDERRAYGRIDYLITPCAGEGETWVSAERLTLAPEPSAPDAEREKGEPMTCRFCHRNIIQKDGLWIDPEATGDDSIWRETCERHDTFTAEHQPQEPATASESPVEGLCETCGYPGPHEPGVCARNLEWQAWQQAGAGNV